MVRFSWLLVSMGMALGPAIGSRAEAPLTPGIRILVVRTEAEAEGAVAAANAGTAFDRLVRERSIGPNAPRGGYLGKVDPATLSPQARAALAGTRRGRLSPIFRTEEGFAVIQVVTEREEQELEVRARHEPDAQELLRRGIELGNRGDLEGAVPLLRRAVELNPGLADAYFSLGIAYARLKRLDAAIAAMREAVRLQPDDDEAQMHLGEWLSERGLYAEACKVYERAAMRHMDSRETWLKLAQSYDAVGDARGAVAAYRRVLGLLGRDDPTVVGALFHAAMQAGDGPAAVEAARKLRAFLPGHAGFLDLGEALLLNGQAAAAATEFRMAAALAPSSAEARAGLASAYARMGQGEAAAESYQRAIQLDPKNPELYRRLAKLYEAEGRPDLAIVALRDGQSAAAASPPALQAELAQQLAALYEKAGMAREAERERARVQALRSP